MHASSASRSGVTDGAVADLSQDALLRREDYEWGQQGRSGSTGEEYVVPRAGLVDDDSPVLSHFSTSDPRTSVLMTRDPLAGFPTERRQPFTPARWLSYDPDRPVLSVITQSPGLLVIADTWMPGWSARVDGRPAGILRGNLAQRVIPLDTPGPHRIELEYHPPGLSLGLAATSFSFLLWLALVVLLHAKPAPKGILAMHSLSQRRRVHAGPPGELVTS
jgi:hypothetical protein